MTTDTCKFCRKRLNINYFGFCSVICCVDYSSEQGITFEQAKESYSCHEIEIETLKDKVIELENEISYLGDEIDNNLEEYKNDTIIIRKDVDDCNACIKQKDKDIKRLKDEIKLLKNIDWEKIKKERAKELKFNEAVERKLINIMDINFKIKEANESLIKTNALLREQNIDLLQSIKNLKHYSSRFELMDLEYDN